jgi:hypothetical protein
MDDHEALVAAVDYVLTSGHEPDKHKTLKANLAEWLKVQYEHLHPFPDDETQEVPEVPAVTEKET